MPKIPGGVHLIIGADAWNIKCQAKTSARAPLNSTVMSRLPKMISPSLKHVAVVFFLTISATTCGGNPNIDEKMSYWTQQLSERTPTGTAKSDVEKYLKETGLEYSYLESEKSFYAIDRDVHNRWLIYHAAVTIRIQLDNEEKVLRSTVADEYTGL